MPPQTSAPVSVEAFQHIARNLPRAELVGGQVIELTPPGFRHGALAAFLAGRLGQHVSENRLGIVVTECGFILSTAPPTVRAPDAAVAFRPRVPSPLPAGFFEGAPDLAVEVLSPGDSQSETAARVMDFLRAGSRAVWVIDPETGTVTVYTLGDTVKFGGEEILRNAPPLPNFTLSLRELFEELP